MSFHLSAEDIEVDDGHILRAKLQNGDGDTVDAEIDLNHFIGNDNGSFQWGGESTLAPSSGLEALLTRF